MDRQHLRLAGQRVVLEHADLGGAMTYCARRSMGSQRQRFAALDPLWSRLKRSWAPHGHKCTILVQALWAKAFHAIGITLVPWKGLPRHRSTAPPNQKLPGYTHPAGTGSRNCQLPGIEFGPSLQLQINSARFLWRTFCNQLRICTVVLDRVCYGGASQVQPTPGSSRFTER